VLVEGLAARHGLPFAARVFVWYRRPDDDWPLQWMAEGAGRRLRALLARATGAEHAQVMDELPRLQ
jgi:hypothetical protein